MEFLIAAGLLGVLAVFLVPFVQQYVTKIIPSTLASNVIVQVIVVGAILYLGLHIVSRLGFGKYVREAA